MSAPIGPYVVEGELGRGGMGAVFRGRAPDGRAVALKVLHRGASPAQRERFERERRLLASLSETDGFVPWLDVGEEARGPYLVMPLVEGGTLRDKLEQGPLAIDAAIVLGEKLALALTQAHDRGIVHRDLKPENVLFDKQGKPLVADLGLAKHFAGDSPVASHYMAPEQLRGAKDVGPGADVFSLGAILHECLAGRPAFEGESAVELLAKIEKARVGSLASARSDTPRWLVRVVETALAKDPALRYSDARALGEALRRREAGSRAANALAFAGVAAAGLVVVAGVALAAVSPGPGPAEVVAPPDLPSTAPDGSARDTAQLVLLLASDAPVTSRDVKLELLVDPKADVKRVLDLMVKRGIVLSVEDAARLRQAHRGADADSLVAVADFVAGRVKRADAEHALLDARAPITDVGVLAIETDRIVKLCLEERAGSRSQLNDAEIVHFVRLTGVVAKVTPELLDAAVAPLAQAFRDAALCGPSISLSSLFEELDREPGWLPPRLRGSAWILAQSDPSLFDRRKRSGAELEAEADKVAAVDTDAAAILLGRAIAAYENAAQSDAPRAPLRKLDALAAKPDAGPVPRLVRARTVRDLIGWWYRLGVAVSPDELARAVKLAKEACALGRETRAGKLVWSSREDQRTLTELQLEVGDTKGVTPLETWHHAELLRLRKDPAGALALLPSGDDVGEEDMDALAVRILAKADLRRIDDARHLLDVWHTRPFRVVPSLRRFRPEELRQYVDGRAR